MIAAWVVRGPQGMWLGGVRSDGGPYWRLRRRDAVRYRDLAEAEAAAAWCSGTVEVSSW